MYNILVCDDDKEIVEAIEIYLTKEGYFVVSSIVNSPVLYEFSCSSFFIEPSEVYLLI